MYSISFTPDGGDHESAVHDPLIGNAGLPADRLGDLSGDLQSLGHGSGVEEGEEVVGAGVGTHPARVRAAVVGESPLVVLDRRGGHNRPSVAEALQGELLALQLFLDGHAGVAL